MEPTETPEWSLSNKLLFRFFFSYFLLFIIFNPNGVVPYIDDLFNWYIQPFHHFIPWLGSHVLHLSKPITVFTNGSGDTTFDNVVLLLTAFLAVLGTAIWSILDRKRPSYQKLFYWLLVILRYYVAITMFSYGFFKVIKLQFPFLSLNSLIEPYGDSSPMGLAWRFMGYSTGYNYFTGFAELSCGFLLLFRRTSALGAVMTLIVSANIMAINYCFDVPVKLLSTTLVIMSLFLIFKEFGRYKNFFLLNKNAEAADIIPHRFQKKWKNIILCVLKYALIFYTIFFDLKYALEAEKEYGSKAPKPPLYGIYEAKTFIVNQDTLAPLITDTTRWRKLVTGYAGYASVKLMNDSTRSFAFKVDTQKRTIIMNSFTDTVNKYVFTYSKPKKDSLLIKGTYKKNTIEVGLHREDESKFLLVKRGFHWINEYPFNR